MATCNWPISATQHITFEVLEIDRNWEAIGGVYIFAATAKPSEWTALYIGETEDFSDRLPAHERLQEACQCGATHIHVLALHSAIDRYAIEQAMIRYLQPPLNTQGK